MITINTKVTCDSCGLQDKSLSQLLMVATPKGQPSHIQVLPGFPEGWGLKVDQSIIETVGAPQVGTQVARQLCPKCAREEA